jgi:hypothetical protein
MNPKWVLPVKGREISSVMRPLYICAYSSPLKKRSGAYPPTVVSPAAFVNLP